MKTIIALLTALTLVACSAPDTTSLTILHTNDTHSQIEPVTSGSNANKGGYARRMGMIEQERAADADLLLFDSGDFSQGTPYFNFFHGRVEVDALNQMGYDAVTLGNHEFDNGVDTLAAVLREAKFAVVCSNYGNIDASPLNGLVKRYIVLERKNARIGVLGLGVQPAELITPQNFTPLVWQNPLEAANEVADYLREEKHCNLIICLSHLGTDAEKTEICDRWIAENSRNIDIILGAHTHKVVTNEVVTNRIGKDVLLSQMGKTGARVGKITIELN